jgi:hypothetical protein
MTNKNDYPRDRQGKIKQHPLRPLAVGVSCLLDSGSKQLMTFNMPIKSTVLLKKVNSTILNENKNIWKEQ